MGQMTVEPDPLVQGGSASIRVEGVSGDSLRVRVDNGREGDAYREEFVDLAINDQGVAEGSWAVPSSEEWDSAIFTILDSDIDSVSRLIVEES